MHIYSIRLCTLDHEFIPGLFTIAIYRGEDVADINLTFTNDKSFNEQIESEVNRISIFSSQFKTSFDSSKKAALLSIEVGTFEEIKPAIRHLINVTIPEEYPELLV